MERKQGKEMKWKIQVAECSCNVKCKSKDGGWDWKQQLQSRLHWGRIDDRFSRRQGQKEAAWAASTPGVYPNVIFRQTSWLNINIHWVESCPSGNKNSKKLWCGSEKTVTGDGIHKGRDW